WGTAWISQLINLYPANGSVFITILSSVQKLTVFSFNSIGVGKITTEGSYFFSIVRTLPIFIRFSCQFTIVRLDLPSRRLPIMLYPQSMPVSVSPSCIRSTSQRAMSHLADTVKAALTDPHAPLWLPDVTAALVEMGQQMLHLQTGITMSSYGTARV